MTPHTGRLPIGRVARGSISEPPQRGKQQANESESKDVTQVVDFDAVAHLPSQRVERGSHFGSADEHSMVTDGAPQDGQTFWGKLFGQLNRSQKKVGEQPVASRAEPSVHPNRHSVPP
jgi:hypothetical protein